MVSNKNPKNNSMASPANFSRNWLELPSELTTSIFHRVGTMDVLMNARKVCKTWRRIGSDPEMWKVVDIDHSRPRSLRHTQKLARKAVEMSCGQLVDLKIEQFADDELINFIADRSSQLRRLRLIECVDITPRGFSEMVKKLPFLEELHLYKISAKAIAVAGQYCPKLKSFEMNSEDYACLDLGCDEDALAIAENMPGLCHLQLFGNLITRNGLLAILENCPHLESLDIRQCSHAVNLGPDLLRRLSQQMKYLKLPDDATEDCELDDDISDLDSISDDDDDIENSEGSDIDDSEGSDMDSDDICRCQCCLVAQEIWNKWTRASS